MLIVSVALGMGLGWPGPAGIMAEGIAVAPVATAPAAERLPVVHLEAAEGISRERRVACGVRFSFTEGQTVAERGEVRLHGASSLRMPKKSFAVTLERAVAVPSLRKSTHWVLNAAYIDRSLMRHKLSYDLFRAMSKEGAPRPASGSRFVELHLNGQYHGAYLLMERVDRSLLGLRRETAGDLSRACIYKAIDHSGDFARPGHGGFEQREPDDKEGPYWGPLDELTKFISSAPDAAFFDEKTGIGSRVDLNSAMDFHLLVLMTSNIDGIDKNFMIARDAVVAGRAAPKFFFVPWDYDATFGRSWNAWPVGSQEWMSNHLLDRLMKNAAYRKQFGARWKELRAGPFSVERVSGMIDENVRTLGQAAGRNWARWENAGGYPDRLTFEEDVAAMKTWVKERAEWLDGEIGRRVVAGAN